jgi:hypothetical protein
VLVTGDQSLAADPPVLAWTASGDWILYGAYLRNTMNCGQGGCNPGYPFRIGTTGGSPEQLSDQRIVAILSIRA